MNLLVQVKDGNIEVVEARSGAGPDRGIETHRFGSADEAVALVAERVAETSCPVAFHHSCDHPGVHGRGDFLKRAFVADLQDAIYRIQNPARLAA